MDHTHCLSPARAREADAAITSSSYARLFPDLPAFTADEAFLYALGRAGGLCDRGDEDDGKVSDFRRARPSRVASMKHRCLVTKSALRGLVGVVRRRSGTTSSARLTFDAVAIGSGRLARASSAKFSWASSISTRAQCGMRLVIGDRPRR